MRTALSLFLFCLFLNIGFSQKNIDATLKKLNKNSVPYISVEELASAQNLILLDTRQKEEFTVSKIKNAVWVGYKKFKIEDIQKKIPNRNTPIVVYCSIGVRSEDIGEKLQNHGYTKVKNLYGGIFEWKNKGRAVYNAQNKKTKKVHAFSKQWGKLLTNAEKIYTINSKSND